MWILWATGFVLIMVFAVALIMYFAIRNVGVASEESRRIVNRFEPDNDSPKLTELIQFHKTNGKIDYYVRDRENK